jgi:hypothetical protein
LPDETKTNARNRATSQYMSTPTSTAGRIVGFRHRVKATKEGEARPTIAFVRLPGGQTQKYELGTAQDELDWLYGRYVTSWRNVKLGEDLSGFPEWHIQRDKVTNEPRRIPAGYDGLKLGDRNAATLGGSGDYFLYALVAKGADVYRIAPFKLQEERGDAKKDDDASLLARLLAEKPELFEETTPLAKSIARLRVSFRLWQDAMKDRIASGNRFLSAFVGRAFLDAGEMPPEQALTKLADEAKAKDPGTLALEREEGKKLLQVQKDLALCDIWTMLFQPIEGVGPSIGARIIAGVISIQRFATFPKFNKFCGTHCLDDGSFARRRNGVVANWSGEVRQGLYLLGDQFNRRPGTVWGTRLRENKVMYRNRHPHPVLETKGGDHHELNPETATKGTGGAWKVKTSEGEVTVTGKLRYTDAHIHKMALWRTLTEFAEWLYKAWWDIEEKREPVTPESFLSTKEHRGIAGAYVKKEKKPKAAKGKMPENVVEADFTAPSEAAADEGGEDEVQTAVA